MSLKYLNDSQHSIELKTDKGEELILNPFDPDYNDASSRISSINGSHARNLVARFNYETAVKNAQLAIETSRPHPPLPTPPECEYWPDDFRIPKSTKPWDPPLLKVVEKVVNKSEEGKSTEKEVISGGPEVTNAELLEEIRALRKSLEELRYGK